MENVFEMATRNKFRFEFRGLISVEDLWDLKLEQLDEVYKTLTTDMKKANEESLLKIKTKDQKEVELKIKIVKYIVELRLAEIENRNKEKKKKEQKQHILELINKKENQELENKSIEELKSMINSLE
ncbi:TPA: hypothetical protein SHW33_002872 [Clostridioides difficile]|uniref:hypothetical protein n=1 Tax=Clostridioides difficile TaxID=1496 RepID=UPI00016C6280|nr:hypothetical protein [Clostridioides difficile]OFU06796.1 hypothetical protein HMPREF3083_06580 [Clostridium sp. HMSC19D07]EGT4183897.1 hypothetical protein [Clostridioides difficile]EGT4214796.1 hypothetical protein [Clostridioides difficile]EGT4628453.1 hypothetical protein [Clostridioides difficile]EGT5282630.1 hypothetical protein [Clostridioides difficile]